MTTKKARALRSLEDLTPDPRNANKGTERGASMLEASLRQYGAGRSILVDRDGVVIAGNKTLEQAAALDLPINVIQSDGRALVVVQRTDVSMDDPSGKELAIADNRTSEVGLNWNTAELENLFATGANAAPFWSEQELAGLFGESPEFGPVGLDEQGQLDTKALTECPACGHLFEA